MAQAADIPSSAGGDDPVLRGLGRTGAVLALLGVFTVVGLVFATHLHVYHRVEWPLALWWGLKDWYLWGALAPLVVWLVHRVPPSREAWPLAVALHGLAAFSLALLHPVLAIALSAPIEGLGDAGFLESVRGLFLKRYTLSLTTYVAIAAVAHAVLSHRHSRTREDRAARLAAALRDASVKPTGEPAARLLVRDGDREFFVEVDRIDRIEAEGNYVRIHAGGERYLERRTLKSLEAQLDPSRFLRVHRSHIVNVERVDRIEPGFKGAYEVVLRDGTSLSLSRTYRKRLEERIGDTF